MELKYIVMTIIKILISVPAVLLVSSITVNAAALMGGHLDNKNNTTNESNSYLYDYEFYDDNQELIANTSQENLQQNSTDYLSDGEYESGKSVKKADPKSEEIPDPSPLVLPGYNLPENIFNKGKPFYLEKDPLTGAIDFNSKSSLRFDDEYEDYVDDTRNTNIYDKSNIDRKDGNIGSHRPSDVNQLVPNFHDFLNLPVKYNSDKYVYPLISSSYANTKIQGNVNKHHNHKEYTVTTYKPTISPTYYLTTKNPRLKTENPTTEYVKKTTSSATTTTTTTSTTRKPTTEKNYKISNVPNLMNSPMNHPSFNVQPSYTTQKSKTSEIYFTTENVNNIYLTTKAPTTITTTHKILSLFEQLFGEYDDQTDPPSASVKPPPLFTNLPSNKNKYDDEKPISNTNIGNYPNAHAGPNILTETNMGHEISYDYDDEEYDMTAEDNIAVETKTTAIVTTSKPTTVTRKTIITTDKNFGTTQNAPEKKIILVNQNKTNEHLIKEDVDKRRVSSSTTSTTPRITSSTIIATKVTSLPLGENHINTLNNKQPIIVSTQNLREQLNNEKIPNSNKNHAYNPSSSSIHIAPDQDSVSFVVGNHQHVDDGGQKESPYDNNPFRPLYETQEQPNIRDSVTYTVQVHPELHKPTKPIKSHVNIGGSEIMIHPSKHSETSLAIGVPMTNNLKTKPGQVVDEKLDLNKETEFPKGTGAKIVFPDEKHSTYAPNWKPPPLNREVLKLNSKPMLHQLPSDLTPPSEKEFSQPPRLDRPRPPWDPRPGHFYSGRPEYVRPPRPLPGPDVAYKRIDNLPNILPQFRPNAKPSHGPQHFENKNYMRQPLLDRPSNRPIGFFEKLQPPPPPKNLHNLRKIPALENEMKLRPNVIEERVHQETRKKPIHDQFAFLHAPPKVIIPKKRNENEEIEVETLQMIQAKADKKDGVKDETLEVITGKTENSTEKPLYVVYPVNTPPLKLDVIDTNKKEVVVIGTRAEKPLPPSKINQDFNYNENPILIAKDRNDAPVLKPHPRPPSFPIKSDFPYPLERPDPSVLNPAVPETPSNNGNNLDGTDNKFGEEQNFVVNNQWNTISDMSTRMVTGSKINTNQISATLKTYTEKPIAVAYTPTQPPYGHLGYEKYSMPNYDGPVIPEIRLGNVNNAEIVHGKPNNEFTVSAIMHTHPQVDLSLRKVQETIDNHRADVNLESSVSAQDFQAPFQASVSIDSMNQGWSIIRNKNVTRKDDDSDGEITTLSAVSTSEFDIENFKPTLIGGFKPIYSIPDDSAKDKEIEMNDREE